MCWSGLGGKGRVIFFNNMIEFLFSFCDICCGFVFCLFVFNNMTESGIWV